MINDICYLIKRILTFVIAVAVSMIIIYGILFIIFGTFFLIVSLF